VLCHRDSTVIVLRCILSSTSFFSFLLLLDLRPYQTAAINKMVLLKDVQGRVYKFKSNSECLGLGIPTLVLPDKVRDDKVLVLGDVPRKLDYVKVMIVSA
jgi:hypothetical protein